MLRDIYNSVCHNKNILMLFTAGIYIFHAGMFAVLLSVLHIFSVIKDVFPLKIIIIWTVVFGVGIFNTNFRLQKTDNLLNLAPVNSVIYGKIISIPESRGDNKIKFFFKVNKIEYDGMVKEFGNEKTLVSMDLPDDKFNIYDSYKIRGRLSPPFKAGNPSQFDYGNYLRNHSAYSVFYGHNPYSMKDLDVPCYEKLNVEKSNPEKVLQWINNSREHILKIHSHYLKSPYLEILGGIVFGDDAVSPPDNIKQSFINSGLLHILAASGMNVAFIYSFFFFLLNLFKVNYRVNISVCILAVLAYVLMTGLGASVVRAALMLLFVLVGKLIDRDAHSIALLAFVAFLMLLYNPLYINDVGFQLSFVVTFGLLVMTPYLIKSKHQFFNWIISSIAIPVIAQLWVIPIQIFYFNNISIYSVFANIMSVPVLFVISFGGFLSSLFSLITPIADFICHIFDFILSPLLKILVIISDFWGRLPNSSYQTTHPNVFQILLYYTVLLNIVWIFDTKIREKWGKFLKCALPVCLIILLISLIPTENKKLEILTFDVGNADSFLIKTPENKYIMIDTGKNGYNGGKSQAEIVMMKYFKDRGIKSLDSIIITHFDNDHCGGAKDLIKGLKVGRIYVNSINHPSKSASEIYAEAKAQGTEITKVQNNQTVTNSELRIVNFISPDTAGIGDNESSVITLLNYKEFSMLFTGDAGFETLKKLKSNIPQNITVLKVGHHGAAGVIDRETANYLNPKYSIVSTGENKFGHPSNYTLEVLSQSRILRTDKDNAIKITVGEKTEVSTYNNKSRKFEKIK